MTHISLTARSWLHDYRMVRYRVALSRVIEHYLAVLADLLWPHATAPGREALTPYLEGFLTDSPSVHEPRARP